jgi:hypothetical protein
MSPASPQPISDRFRDRNRHILEPATWFESVWRAFREGAIVNDDAPSDGDEW